MNATPMVVSRENDVKSVDLALTLDSFMSCGHMANETFHTPSFGDEDFDIPPLGVPQESSGGYETQPLSHPPVTQHGACEIIQNQFTHHQHQQFVAPKFPPQHIDIPDILSTNSQGLSFTTLGKAHLASGLGLNIARGMEQGSPYAMALGANQMSPPPESSSEDSDDTVPLAQLATGLKRAAAQQAAQQAQAPPTKKKPKTPKKKKKKDPNEPQKPVSAYALFFRDTQAAIKGQNPNASFGEVSKIVASMWDSLDPDTKTRYKKKTEMAKKEYLKQLAAYRASLVSKQTPLDAVKESSKSPPYSYQMSPKDSPTSIPSPLHSHPVATMAQQMTNYPSPISQAQNMSPIAPRTHQMAPPMQSVPQVHSPLMTNDNGYSQPMVRYYNMANMHQTGMHSPQDSPCNTGLCTRNGCRNLAIDNQGWDNEYCSNECVVHHCRDVFTAWVSARQATNSYASVK
ncbi:TOX high mobility group box family member 3-like isoform X3 [Lineus longissimus]|uniref:TOX high mobility group box family member 3-like isoform X3 n=1 Tax=Lineus longissimus TaxID=88925 RepID=UPI00315D3291